LVLQEEFDAEYNLWAQDMMMQWKGVCAFPDDDMILENQ